MTLTCEDVGCNCIETGTFGDELRKLLNRFSKENSSNTPDFILADYMMRCLEAYNETVQARAKWYGRIDTPGQSRVPEPK